VSAYVCYFEKVKYVYKRKIGRLAFYKCRNKKIINGYFIKFEKGKKKENL
jgi:hypothetical protein